MGNDTRYGLYFSDNQIVIAKDEDDLSYMIRQLQEGYEILGLSLHLNKCEYLIVGSDECSNLPLDTGMIKDVEKCKYLGVLFNKQGISKDEVQERINKDRKTIEALNSVLWEKYIKKEIKIPIYRTIVQSVTIYGIGDLCRTKKNKLMPTEIDFFRRSCR